MYINKVMLYGNLTRDPEMRAMPSGGSVASFGLATNRTFKKADGSRQEATEFHNIVVFGRQAETCAQYLKKGSPAYIEGRIQTRSWDNKDGAKQYKTEIIAERVQFGPKSSGGTGGSYERADIASGDEAPQKAPKEDAIDYPAEDSNPDDIPF
ncbi:MAG: single-stranded DNA-binding protein [Minisyncoccia bacterium]|jgi:single-strand DNA-binding protein